MLYHNKRCNKALIQIMEEDKEKKREASGTDPLNLKSDMSLIYTIKQNHERKKLLSFNKCMFS